MDTTTPDPSPRDPLWAGSGKTNMLQRLLDAARADFNIIVSTVDLTEDATTIRDWRPIDVTAVQERADTAVRRRRSPATQRVAAGAALLDDMAPGWASRFDPVQLNVADPYACPLAQLYPLIDVPDAAVSRARRWSGGDPTPFHLSLAALAPADGSADEWAAAHGFDRGWDDERNLPVGCGSLTVAWQAEIRHRPPAVTA